MYKYKRNKEKMNCCPYGTNRGNGVVECYYFNLVTLKDCAKCTVRNDRKRVKKGD